MASLRKHPKSKYWYACITLPDGRQTQRSTRETDRKRAFRIAEKYEEASKRRLSEAQARRVIRDLYEIHHHEPLDSATVIDFFSSWLDRKRIETAPNTFTKYESVKKQFLSHLGENAAKDLNFVTRKQIAAFRDDIAKRLSPSTANLALKIIRVAFKQAYRDGLIQSSPADQISIISARGHESERRPFTVDELKIVYREAEQEWKGMILFGLYTGQRLKDIGTLRYSNIDLVGDLIRLKSRKTRRQQLIPIATPLREYITDHLLSSDDPTGYVFPKAAAAVERTGDVRRLSAAFYEILVAAGLADLRSKENTGRGHSVKRRTSELSFHSLRHTATSLMKNAGASPAVVQDLIGHDSAAISRSYTTIEESMKRKAIELIPPIG